MRRCCWVGVLALAGCTSLNADYAADVGTTTNESPVGEASTGEPSAEPPGSSSTGGPVPEATSADESSSEGSTTGSAEVDPDDERVVFLYAAGPWRGDTAGGNATEAARALCAEAPTYAASSSRCASSDPLAVIRTDGVSLEQTIAAVAIALEDLPIYGIASDGSAPLAPNVDVLFLGELEVTLADGGVTTAGTDRFWSGGVGLPANNCSGWNANVPAALDGAVGSFYQRSEWFDAGERSCADPLPILCACISKADPFG